MGSYGLKRRNVAIFILIGIICIVLVYIWANARVNYVPILHDLNGKMLSEVELKFHQSEIPYKISGTFIEVPAGQINQARIELAEAGLPKAGTFQKSR